MGLPILQVPGEREKKSKQCFLFCYWKRTKRQKGPRLSLFSNASVNLLFQEQFSPICNAFSDGPPWVIIGAALGGAVVVAVIIAVVAWWVHKKRKCRRKDSRSE